MIRKLLSLSRWHVISYQISYFNSFFYPVDIYGLIFTGNMSSRKGLNGACSVHEYTGSFIGQSAHFKMTSVCGHVMTLDFIGICSQNILTDAGCKIVKDFQ